MGAREAANAIIRALERSGAYAECPCCQEPVRLSKVGLFYLNDLTPEAETAYEALQDDLKDRAKALQQRRKAIPKQSEGGAQAVNIGFILERLAPSLPSFRFDHTDCRSLFDPIDYVIFEGLSRKGRVDRVFFVDIKTGRARLQQRQKTIKALVECGKVSFDTYRMEDV